MSEKDVIKTGGESTIEGVAARRERLARVPILPVSSLAEPSRENYSEEDSSDDDAGIEDGEALDDYLDEDEFEYFDLLSEEENYSMVLTLEQKREIAEKIAEIVENLRAAAENYAFSETLDDINPELYKMLKIEPGTELDYAEINELYRIINIALREQNTSEPASVIDTLFSEDYMNRELYADIDDLLKTERDNHSKKLINKINNNIKEEQKVDETILALEDVVSHGMSIDSYEAVKIGLVYFDDNKEILNTILSREEDRSTEDFLELYRVNTALKEFLIKSINKFKEAKESNTIREIFSKYFNDIMSTGYDSETRMGHYFEKEMYFSGRNSKGMGRSILENKTSSYLQEFSRFLLIADDDSGLYLGLSYLGIITEQSKKDLVKSILMDQLIESESQEGVDEKGKREVLENIFKNWDKIYRTNIQKPKNKQQRPEVQAMVIASDIENMLYVESLGKNKISRLSQEFGIISFGRYPKKLLKEMSEKLEVDQPYGLLILPRADHNTAFHHDIRHYYTLFDELNALGYTIRIIEAESTFDLTRKLIGLDRRYGVTHKISFALIGGHGTEGSIQFGYENSHKLSIADIAGMGAKKARRMFTNHFPLVLFSCSTGKKGGIAQKASENMGIDIIAPTESTFPESIHVKKKDGDLLFDVKYFDVDTAEYNKGNYQEEKIE